MSAGGRQLSPGRLMLSGAAAAALLYLLLAGSLFAWQRHILFPGAFLDGVPNDLTVPPGVASTAVFTADGIELRALWKNPRPGCGVVVSFHGNRSFPEQGAARFAAGPWARDGWGLLAIAYRGYPGSTGRPSETGLIADGLAAYAEARRRAPASPILLHGHSMGAAIAIAVAEREPRHQGLYLEAPFASVLRLARQRFPFVPLSLLLRDPMRSDLGIGKVHGPILIVHGSEDRVIPIEEGRRLADSAPPGTVFQAIAGDHVSILGARDNEAEAGFQRAIGGCPSA